MKSQNKIGKIFLILLVLMLSSQFALAAFTIKENTDGAMGFYIDGVEKAFLNSTVFNISAPIYTTNIYSGGEEIDTSNLVPYSGANSNLDLGVYNLTAQEVIIKNGADEYKLSWEDSYPGFYAPYGDFFFGVSADQTTYVNYYVGTSFGIGASNNMQDIWMYGNLSVLDSSMNSIFEVDTTNDKVTVGGLLNVTGNVTSDTDFCIDGGNCLSTAGTGNISGTGSANKIPYFTDASTISYNSNLHWDNTNVRLGIGTASPSAKLDVKVNSGDDRSILLTDTAGDGTGHPRLTTSAGTLFLHSASGNFQLQSDMLPSSTNTLDMGSSARYFAEGYFNKSFAYDLQVTNHTTLNTLDVTGNVTSDTDFCIDGGNCLSTVSSADFNESKLFNTTKVLHHNDSVTIYNPISYYEKGTTTGEINIEMPLIPDDALITAEFTLRENGYFKEIKFETSCHITSAGWNSSNCMLYILGNSESSFYGTDFDFLKLDTTTKGWSAGGFSHSYEGLYVSVDKVTISGTNLTEDWTNGWDLYFDTNFNFPSRIGQVHKIWNNNNDGEGSFLDADFLQGKAGGYFVYGNEANTGNQHYASNASLNLTNNTQMNRVYFGGANNALDNPYTEQYGYNAGSPYGWFSNVPLVANNGFGLQTYVHSSKDQVWYRRCYPFTSCDVNDWFKIVDDDFDDNTKFTGNHTQDGDLEVTGNLNASATSGWIYFGNGGGLYWNSTHSCIVGPDGNVSNAVCDTD